ncbi:AAEL007973-PA [Aedes aegypti]|uniref:AAEL007973-PA n=1 Tax=Aedes aegypti TaxID=7159 RepID=Q170B7_AEDAE|nr:AAEL007973-PA [Aedes aegypti]
MQVVGRIELATKVQLNRSETSKKKNIRRDNHVEKVHFHHPVEFLVARKVCNTFFSR